jgi:site-specific DNA-cytosine methylase
MDTAKTTHISLCTGYGGIDLGLRRAIPNLRTVAYAEIEAFACENLLARMEAGQLDAAPIWSDLKSFPWKEFSGLVDILSGGYPCQPFSAAGKRLGTEDPRHLWPYIADGIRVLRPRICFFENVEGHISLGLSDVIEDLAGMGYRTTWGIFSASECGAPHQRKRVFILAVASGFGGAPGLSGSVPRHEGHPRESDDGGYQAAWPSRPGEQQYAWEPARVITGRQIKSTLGGNFNEPPSGLDYAQLCVTCDNRTDELRLLGNGVVPATAERAFRILIAELFPQ